VRLSAESALLRLSRATTSLLCLYVYARCRCHVVPVVDGLVTAGWRVRKLPTPSNYPSTTPARAGASASTPRGRQIKKKMASAIRGDGRPRPCHAHCSSGVARRNPAAELSAQTTRPGNAGYVLDHLAKANGFGAVLTWARRGDGRGSRALARCRNFAADADQQQFMGVASPVPGAARVLDPPSVTIVKTQAAIRHASGASAGRATEQ